MNSQLYNHSKELMSKHQWETVINELDNETLQKSADWRLYWNVGWSNFKINQLSAAKKHFEQAAQIADSPDDESTCLAFLGITALQSENYEEAKIALVQSLELKDSTIARQNLAVALMNLDKVEEAEQVHLDGLKPEPDNKERLAAYGNFLLDTGRNEEAAEIRKKLK